MEVLSSQLGKKEVISLSGQFVMSKHQDFYRAMSAALQNLNTEEIVVDLAGVHYLDSSACGMLIMLRQKAIETGKTVALASATGSVREALNIMNFGKLFPMR